MDAKEAKEIMRTHKGISPSVRTDPDWYYASEFMMANGYLNALNGPEVKALVDIVDDLKHCVADLKGYLQMGYSLEEIDIMNLIKNAEEALAAYKEAVGKPGEGERE